MVKQVVSSMLFVSIVMPVQVHAASQKPSFPHIPSVPLPTPAPATPKAPPKPSASQKPSFPGSGAPVQPPPPPPTPPPVQEAQKKVEPKPPEKSEDEIRVGPMVGLALFAGPNIGAEAKLYKYFGAALSLSMFNGFDLTSIDYVKQKVNEKTEDYSVGNVKLNYMQFEAKGMYFPFAGSFFLGLALGHRIVGLASSAVVQASIPESATPVETNISLDVVTSTTYWNPQFGWLYRMESGLTFGTDIGVQMPITSSVEITIDIKNTSPFLITSIQRSPQYVNLRKQLVNDVYDMLSEYPIPYWNIIKVGWLF